jgi:MoaA/NifB/PqqE/SkfB family radical SAM enzyme
MEIWNSPDARDIRSSILDGTFRYCDLERCPYFTSGSLPLQKNITEGPYAEIIRRGISELETTKVFLAMDPRCNLRCISCRNDFAVIDEQEKATVHRSMEALKADISLITAIGLAGSGDPFVSPETREFLFSHDVSQTPHLKLYILTNGLLLNRKCWQRMEASRRAVAAIQVSIDAATEVTYEKIRIGGSFASLRENLSFIGELRQRGDIGEFIISFVVNALNYREMPLFAGMGFDLGCDQIAFSYMSDWLNLSREDYQELAVHLPGHREYSHLRAILNDPILGDPRVFLHNLSGLKGGRIMGESMFV